MGRQTCAGHHPFTTLVAAFERGVEAVTDAKQPMFASAPNLRDAGGHATPNGGRVRTGLLYRSEQLSRVTDDEMGPLAALGLKKIYDLRTGFGLSGTSVSRLISIRSAGSPLGRTGAFSRLFNGR